MTQPLKMITLITIFIFSHLLWLPGPANGDEKLSEVAINKPVGLEQAGYRIDVGDILSIMTWKEPDFTIDALVRLDGKITFPLLDDVQAAGLRPMELKKEIQKHLTQYIEDPIVTVMVKHPNSHKFYILGEIRQTGEYPLNKALTALQAFALAGGFTEWASKKKIIVLRREKGRETFFKINYKDIVKGKELSNNIWIRSNDTIIVP